MDNQDLIKEYHEREVKWAEKSLNHLSFFNNLLLTLSVGFLSFSYKGYSLKALFFTVKDINWSLTMTILSLIMIAYSILVGLTVTINRLFDFRLTRHINQIRHRMIEHSAAKMDESTPDKFNFLRRSILPLEIIISFPKIITIEECKNFKNMPEKRKCDIRCRFRELRNIAHNVGLNSWRKTFVQIFYFGLSLVLYVIGELIK